MLTKFSITTINLYQRYLSPHKGYCCAHRAYTGEDSCSQYAKIAIGEHGLFSSFPLIKEQFEKCSFAANEMKKQREKRKKDGSYNDCVPSCDAGACDAIGDCHPFH